ncbi:stage II sporulation protein M [uncultured Methanobrevibacter sp.]|uniref:stage II sporulation protein M n=1 Tax=uncultured Methanobrevibacter sp. TaxID=253161 RepID=UPI0025F00E5B|nr:stage II sporulation protein M [uncultured Methanobrevibacter sp.]
MLDFKKEIRSAFSENKMAICISMAILLISLILGYVLEPNLHAYLNPVVENLSKQVETGNIKLTFHSIFSNNIRIVFFMFIFGLLCCFSALILAFNGFFVGYFVAVNSNDMFKTLLLLIPHGIFEFSSCIIACASGFVLFKFLYRFLKAFARNDEGSLSNQLYESYVENFDKLKQSIMLLLVATVLMIIAGIFEVYLTLPIANFILSISS